MSDYISREAAILQKCDCEAYDPKTGMIFECDAVPVERINAIPPADVRPVVRGEWIPVINGRGGHECDQCHDYAPSWQVGGERLSNFCPNCGADMREEGCADHDQR